MSATITKRLSANDIGSTGSHQAGILVPKNPAVLSFFPPLDASTKNPRQTLSFSDADGMTVWNFEFIYYNGKLFGGTRNEYRLTAMTRYLRAIGARVGDELVFRRDKHGGLHIALVQDAPDVDSGVDYISLAGGWKVISTKK